MICRKAHPDKGGTKESFRQVRQDFNLLKRHLGRRGNMGIGLGQMQLEAGAPA